MREIKFRVHDADTGEVLAYEHFNTALNWGYYWLDAKELAEKGGEAVCHAPVEYFKHPHPLGSLRRALFTGLKDKNGKEIYEGDIIRHQLNNAGIEKNKTFAISSVIFVRGAFTVDYNPKILIWGLGYNCTEDGQLGHVEVIGNIWENKELLND